MKTTIYKDINAFSEKFEIEKVAALLHEMLKPFEDTVPQIVTGLKDALTGRGFVCLGQDEESGKIIAICTILKTGMSAYIPENFLLYVAVDPKNRGKGLGRTILEEAFSHCDGDIKLHVEHDNPAQRLYERIGFTSKYREMRLSRPK